MTQDSAGQQDFEGRSRNHLTVFAEVIKHFYSPCNHCSRPNALTAKVVPQQCLFNCISPRCASGWDCKQQRSLHFTMLWMLQSLLWCLENPSLNAQWNFNGRYAPVRPVCNCSIKLTSQKSVFEYRHEIISVLCSIFQMEY